MMDASCYDKFNLNFTFLYTNKSITSNYNTAIKFKQEKYYDCIQAILFSLYMVIILLLSSETKYFNKIYQTALFSIISTITQCVAIHTISLLCLVISFIISPIIITILLIFNSYRLMVHLVLKWQHGHNFAGLMEGTDAIWAIEDVSKCIINILITIQSNDIDQLHLKLKQKMFKIIHDGRFEKLGYERDKAYGYYFWKKVKIDVDNNVKYMKALDDNEIGLNKIILQGLLSKYVNKSMPNNHASSWEILIGTQPLLKEKETVTNNNYPVLFRFHHSVGDGIALLRILLEVVDDTNQNKHGLQNCIDRETVNNVSFFTSIIYRVKSHLISLLSVIFIPGHLLYLNMIRSVDNNIIHGADLTGDKVIAWSLEKEDFHALRAVKQIKAKFPESSFNDILLTALSESLYNYFKQNTDRIPASLTVVVPERRQAIFSTEHRGLEINSMQNRFSVGMLDLPLLPQTGCERESSALERLQEVRQQTTFLKNASDYQINYWLMRVVVKILPESMLRAILYSTHSTLVMSNIIGPEKVTICDGLSVNDIVFWIPHRGLTGIGVSVISYDTRLELGLNVDRALVSNVEDAQNILDGIFDALKKLHDSIL